MNQTHCSICNGHLKRGGVWCYSCGTYLHVGCSGLKSSRDHYEGFICPKCKSANANPSAAPENRTEALQNSPSSSTDAPSADNINYHPSDFWNQVTEEKQHLSKCCSLETILLHHIEKQNRIQVYRHPKLHPILHH